MKSEGFQPSLWNYPDPRFDFEEERAPSKNLLEPEKKEKSYLLGVIFLDGLWRQRIKK